MHPRRTSALAAVAALAVLSGLAGPALAGPPGKWTVISGGGISNIDRPGLYRTADATLHVAFTSESGSDSVEVAHVSASGKSLGRHSVVSDWSATTWDPVLVGAPGGGMRIVFGGMRTTTPSDPYSEGYLYQGSSDAAGAAWTLAPSTTPAVASPQGYASYGTGVATLPDGTLVTAFPLNTEISYQVGAGPVQTFTVPDCCAYHVALAADGGSVYAAWYANGDSASTRGVFVRQIYPTLGATVQAPGSVTKGDSLDPGQRVAMVTRAGGGIYLAYLKGYPTTKSVALWKLGTNTVKNAPASKAASNVALSAGPAGRLWLAYDDGSDDLHAVRTNPSGMAFGAVQTLKTPGKSPAVYALAIEGSSGHGDVVFNDSLRILHQQVFAGLTLEAAPTKWNGNKSVKVSFTVTDAGDPVKGAKVKAKGKKCTTDKKGVCTITFPKSGAGKFVAVAEKNDYADGSVRLKVT